MPDGRLEGCGRKGQGEGVKEKRKRKEEAKRNERVVIQFQDLNSDDFLCASDSVFLT